MFETKTVKQTEQMLKTDMHRGLSGEEAQSRYSREGPNRLASAKKKSLPVRFLEQLNDPLIYVLLAAAAISLLLREVSDAVIIIAVVGLNAFVGMAQEGKAQKALDSLKKLTQPAALVIRDGKETLLEASRLVPGDLVCLEAGCQVPADLRLTETGGLKAEESTLTGETVPVTKDAALCLPKKEKGTPLGDRKNMAYMSTVITAGRGKGIVVSTGMKTEIGKIASMMTESEEEPTPLQKKLGELGTALSLLSLGICALLFGIALFQHRNVFDMLLTAISLAVAAVPEGLPAVVTLCLALSVTRMVKVNTIVRRLPSVETLGAVSVVCSDKTGTLTQNRMQVLSCYTDGGIRSADGLDEKKQGLFLEGMALCSDAVLSERIGDPTELALLELAGRYGIRKGELEQKWPRKGEIPFQSERKMMTTWHRGSGGTISVTKGAPDRVLKLCTCVWQDGREEPLTDLKRRRIENAVEKLSADALRTLAVACKRGAGGPEEKDLLFLGIAGMKDPVRPEAAEAVEIFGRAGVDTVMITGDHVNTAFAIARQLHIAKEPGQCMTGEELNALPEKELEERLDRVRVFARVSPADKVKIVRGFQKKGNIVAMTGDGVNDAPSLKIADVGVAMGKGGTDVARQAADLVLTDDNFATIEKAIEEGRGVYENIKKSVVFLLSSNLGEILTMFAAVTAGLASPLRSGHILWINLITDSLPALALGVDYNDGKELMGRPPRGAKESLFSDRGLSRTIFFGALIAGISLTAFFTLPWTVLKARGLPFLPEQIGRVLMQGEILARSQTYAFTVLGMSQLFHAVGMRDVHKSVFRMNHLENRLMILACLAGFFLQFLVTEAPFLVSAFSTARLTGREWLYLTGMSAFPLLAHELLVLLNGDFFRKDSAS